MSAKKNPDRVTLTGFDRVPFTQAILHRRDEQTLAALIFCFEIRHDAEKPEVKPFESWPKFHPPTTPKEKPVKKLTPILQKIPRYHLPQIFPTPAHWPNLSKKQQLLAGKIRAQWLHEGRPRYFSLPFWVVKELNQELRREYAKVENNRLRSDPVWDTQECKFRERPRPPQIWEAVYHLTAPLPVAKTCPKCGAEHYRPDAECGKWHPE